MKILQQEKAIKAYSVIDGINKPLNFERDGHFYIHGEFDATISTEIVPCLVKVIDEKKNIKNSSIRIYINSHGGYTMYAKEVISLIDKAKSEGITVETYVSGVAYSCGSIVAVSGTRGHRYVGRYAEHLCHLGQAWTSSINDTELKRNNERVKAHFDFVRDVYRENCNIKDLEKVIHDDCLFVRGNKIIQWRLADKVIECSPET